MKQFKNTIRYLIVGIIVVSLYTISTPLGNCNIIFNSESQDTIKLKELDKLQSEINNYNKIAFQFDSIFERKVKAEDTLKVHKKNLTDIELKCSLLKQELKYEEVDSCEKSLNRKLELLYREKESLNNSIKSLNRIIIREEKEVIEIQKKHEIQVNKIQQYVVGINGSYKIKFKGCWYYLFIVNIDSSQILMHHKDSLTKKPYKTIDNVYKALSRGKLKPLMITNAGMYTQSFEPQGLYIEQFKELYPIDTTRPNNDNFYLKPNGVFYLDQMNKPYINTTEDFLNKYRSKKVKVKFATQSGPMLLINGQIHPVFTVNSSNRKIRSGVGITIDKKVVFAISLGEVNFYDFANLFKDIFTCNDALFLDGAISRMFLFDKDPQERGGNFGPIISVVKRTK